MIPWLQSQELKNAGFPQDSKPGDFYYDHEARLTFVGEYRGMDVIENTPIVSPNISQIDAKSPSLKELIVGCLGDTKAFVLLKNGDKYVAGVDEHVVARNSFENALVELYLEKNKKTVE